MERLQIYGIAEFSEKDGEAYFYANDLRTHLESHQFVNSPHKHSTYILVLFTKGSGTHQIDFNSFSVKPGSVFLLNPGQVHSWDLSEDVDGYVFFHTKEFYDTMFVDRKIEGYPFFYLKQNYPVIYVLQENLDKVETIFRDILMEFRFQYLYRNAKIGLLVDLLYIELSRLYQGKDLTDGESHSAYFKIKKLRKLIDDNFRTKKFPKDYADLMNMSTRHLSRICRDALNKTTGELITDRIIIEAKRMLIHTDITISTVSEALGYDDYSYFIRLFKQSTGISPKAFQQGMKKNGDSQI